MENREKCRNCGDAIGTGKFCLPCKEWEAPDATEILWKPSTRKAFKAILTKELAGVKWGEEGARYAYDVALRIANILQEQGVRVTLPKSK